MLFVDRDFVFDGILIRDGTPLLEGFAIHHDAGHIPGSQSSAVEVMVATGGRPHVRQCAAEGCRLYFVDRSPTGHRRWCEKKTCGHRAANLRYYHRRGKQERV